jgi:hypothetical protein
MLSATTGLRAGPRTLSLVSVGGFLLDFFPQWCETRFQAAGRSRAREKTNFCWRHIVLPNRQA